MTDAEKTTLWVGAFRYYLGRTSYAVGDFCSALIKAWPDLPDTARGIISHELGAAFLKDDVCREAGSDCIPLGHNCDREQWERVMMLWNG